MNLILKNSETGDFREVKNGVAFYFLLNLIPGIGLILTAIISNSRKQFKVWISTLIIELILGGIVVAAYTIQEAIPPLEIFYVLLFLVFIVVRIYLYIKISLNLNFWSYNKYMDEGYEVTNDSDDGVEKFIEDAEFKEKPFWILFL